MKRGLLQLKIWNLLQNFLIFCLLICTTFGTSTDTDKTDAFVEWFGRNGGKLTGVVLDHFEEMGRGFRVTAPIKEMNEVVFVPRSITMNSEKAMESIPELQGAKNVLHEDELVALFLTIEKKKGLLSFWHPYIETLPEYIPVATLAADKEIALTEDPRVVASVRRTRQEIEQAFHNIQTYLQKLKLSVSHEEWCWAMAVVSSRAITLQGHRLLAPMMDMINYEPTPDSEDRPFQQGKMYAKYHRMQTEGLRVFSDRNTSDIGIQFFEDYGDNTNALYYEHHGFIPHDNPHDCVYVTVDALHSRHNYDDARTKQRKGELFKKVATKQLKVRSPPYEICIRENGNIPNFLNYYVNIWALEGERLDKCEQVVRVGGNPKYSCAPDNAKLSKDKILLMAIEDRLKGYHTHMIDDRALLENGNLSEHEQLAIKYRLNQKRILYSLRERWCNELGDACPAQTRQHIEEDTHPWHQIEEHMVHPEADESFKVHIAQTLENADIYFTKELDLEKVVTEFNEWFSKFESPVVSIKAQVIPGFRIGAIATKDISAQDLYLSVPVEIVMDFEHAQKDPSIGPLLHELGHLTSWRHDFDLMFHLLYEKFVLGPQSKFYAYLNTLPSMVEASNVPLFFNQERIDIMKGSDVQLEVRNYQDQVQEWYKRFSTSLRAAGFGEKAVSYELFAWAQHILDTRSIWWGGERHLVPMLDLINCQQGPNPEVVHKTDLDETRKFADTFAPWDFSEGEQVFENYGQPNHIYFVYHGFIMAENKHDCVLITLPISMYPNSQLDTFFNKRPAFCVSPDSIPTAFLMFFRLGEKINMNVDTKLMNKIEPKLAVPLTKYFERKINGYKEQEELEKLARESIDIPTYVHDFVSSEKALVEQLLQMVKAAREQPKAKPYHPGSYRDQKTGRLIGRDEL